MKFAELTQEVQSQIREYAREDIELARKSNNKECMITGTQKGLVELRIGTDGPTNDKVMVYYNIFDEMSLMFAGTDSEAVEYLVNDIYEIA